MSNLTRVFVVLVILSFVVGCNGSNVTATPAPSDTARPIDISPQTVTPHPTNTPNLTNTPTVAPIPTATLNPNIVEAKYKLRIRWCPSEICGIVHEIEKGVFVETIAHNDVLEDPWYQIIFDGETGWIPERLVELPSPELWNNLPIGEWVIPTLFEERINIGDYKLHVNCLGDGSPTVIFDAGLGYSGTYWADIQSVTAALTRACYYDRYGTGQSDFCRSDCSQLRTSQQMVDDLHTLLVNAGIEGPYVLVGHSIAGFNLRLFATQYPSDTAGLVLVDSSHPDQFERLNAILSTNLVPASSSIPEHLDFLKSAAQVNATGSLGDIPLVVLIATGHELFPGYSNEVNEQAMQAWLEMQEELASLSSNSTIIIAEESGHIILADQPHLVIDAIRSVVELVRGE